MSDYTKYTKQEMQAYAIAKNIKENQIVIVGTGLPLIGASLAKRAVCPSCHPIVESGLMDCDPVEVPRSVGDNRFMAHCAVQWPNIRFVGFEANEWLHDEDRLVAFIGGAQIDPYGNVNSTHIGGTKMMNGIGGSGDFTRNAYISIFTCPSVAKEGKISAIVPMVSHMDHTEHDVNIIITEQGVADLRGKSPKERAQAIIENCVHPDYKNILWDYLKLTDGKAQTPHSMRAALAMHAELAKSGDMKNVDWAQYK